MLLIITFGIHNISQKDELAPNVMAMVQSFNRLALLVPTEILEEKTPQARSKVITSFIQVREEVPIPSPFHCVPFAFCYFGFYSIAEVSTFTVAYLTLY